MWFHSKLPAESQYGGWLPQEIQKLPLLAANSLMAGKAWQPSHEPTCDRGGEWTAVTLIESVENDVGGKELGPQTMKPKYKTSALEIDSSHT